jgi:hypothetical protein
MINFRLNNNIVYAIDVTGYSVVNKTDGSQTFISYPEAVIWGVLVEKRRISESMQMIQAILDKDREQTFSMVEEITQAWRNSGLII